MDAEEYPIAGLDYKVAATRGVKQGLAIAHVSLTGNWPGGNLASTELRCAASIYTVK